MNIQHGISSTARILLFGFLALQIAHGQTTVSVSPATKNAFPGRVFSLNVTIAGVTDLHLYHAVIHFDNTIIRCEGVSNGGFLPGTFFLHSPRMFPSDTACYVTVDDALAGIQTQSGAGALFTLQFTALQTGVTSVVLAEIVLRDVANQNITHSIGNSSVTVAIPPVVYVDLLYSEVSAGGHDYGFDAFSAIAEGIGAVGSGGTVNVHSGTYREQVYINKNVALVGAGGASTFIAPPMALMSQPFLPARQERPIIGVDSMGVDVIIDGFTIDGEGAGNTQANMVGIQYFKGSGVVRNSTVKRIRSTPFSGAQAFIGIMINHDYPRTYIHSVEIHNDSVYDFGKGGIVCNHPGTTGSVHNNIVIGQGPVGEPLAAQNGIQFGFGAMGTVSSNTIRGFSYTGPAWTASGIVGVGSDGTLDITGNTIMETQTAINLQQTTAYANGGASANVEGNSILASTAGTGVSTYYGMVTWSIGGSVSTRPLIQRIAELSPVDAGETEGLNGAGGMFRPLTSMTISFHNNALTSSTPGFGIGAYLLAAETSPQTVIADSNTFTGYWIAAVTDKDPGATLATVWRKNKFENNHYGLDDLTGVLQDAKENWWGNTTGPRDVKALPATPNYNNPAGTGDSVTAFIDYKPWYLNAAMTSLSRQYFGVRGGWNIVSVPLIVDDWRKTMLFPSAESFAFGFEMGAGYVRRDTLEKGVGYWLKFPTTDSVALNGLWRLEDTIHVVKGWNLIGAISGPIPTITIRQIPPTIVASPFYGFSTAYAAADTLWPARGYWVKANYPGSLVLSDSGSFLEKSELFSREVASEAATLTVSDANGNTQRLLLSTKPMREEELNFFELPPIPPMGVFDVRYSSQRVLECAREGEDRQIPIQVSYGRYPLTIRWEIKSQAVKASLLVGGKELSLNDNSSVTISDQNASISLKLGGRLSLPRIFALSQNYPNPFNPSTTISYQIPSQSHVTLKVYDVLGRETASLVNEVKQPGAYTVQYEGGALANGVYFYRLVAGEYAGTRKMILMK